MGIARSIVNTIKAWGGPKQPQGHVISYPKSGRTWLRVLVGRAICRKFDISDRRLLDTLEATSIAGVLPTEFTHDGSGMREGTTWLQMVVAKADYRDKKVCVLVRDPRDVMVSCYFQATKRINVYDGPISEFIRCDHLGARRCAAFYRNWCENRSVPREFLLVRYEEMKADTRRVLRGVLEFIGVSGIDQSLLDDAVEYASFENMKKMETSQQFQRQVLKPGDVNDQESFKVRRGKVGGYRDYLNDDDCGFLDQVLVEARCPLLEPYLPKAAQNAA